MLILRRRVGETFQIGSTVMVTVVCIRGTQVHIGIHAPRSVPVHREELLSRNPSRTFGTVPAGPRTIQAQASRASRPSKGSPPPYAGLPQEQT
jgi:carbon storage regulator